MYQLTFSIGADYVNWFYAIERKLKKALDGQAVLVTRGENSRLFVAVACENHHKRRVSDTLFAAVTDMLAVEAKRYYYKENLNLPMIGEEKFEILLAALVEFDAGADRQLVKQSVTLESGLNIDGVYNFAFSDIKNRWREIGELTRENALYLTDNEIFFELIKYMFSAIAPKTDSVRLTFEDSHFVLKDGAGEQLCEAASEQELLCSLISYAPITLTFDGDSVRPEVRHKLNAIFGIPPADLCNFLS